MQEEGKLWYYIYDGHGSTRLLTDGKGRVTDRYSYDACGNLLQKEGGTQNDFLYTGEQYNANTGLYYLRARYMDPSTGTFISMDSYPGNLNDPVSLHKYLYANANPVMNTDPSGYMSLFDTGVAIQVKSCMEAAQAAYDKMVFHIGMLTLQKLWSITAVVAISYLSTTVLLNLVTDAAFNRDRSANGCDVAVEILQYAWDNIEFICEAAEIASETIANQIKAAIYQTRGGDGAKDTKDAKDAKDGKNSSDVSEGDKTARELLSEGKKGSVNQAFPGEWLDKTKNEIERAAKQGQRSAQKAKKLLTDGGFKKSSNSTRSKKGK